MDFCVCRRSPARGAKRKTRVPAQPCVFSMTQASRPSTATRLKIWIRVSGLWVRGAESEDGRIEGMTGFKKQRRRITRAVLVLAREVMEVACVDQASASGPVSHRAKSLTTCWCRVWPIG